MQFIKKELPTPLPEDDLQYYSDLLRSLETRTDITQRVLLEVNMHMTLYAIATRAHIEHDTRDLKARAGALKSTGTSMPCVASSNRPSKTGPSRRCC